jgi:Flp pilus assembly protein TadB
MDLSSLFIALPIFFLAYQGIGLLMDSRTHSNLGPSLNDRGSISPQQAMREFTNLSAKLGFNKTLLRNKKLSDRLDLLLLRSGYPFGWKSEDFLFCKELGMVFMVILLWAAGEGQPLIWLLGLCLGFWMPDVYMKAKGTARQTAIQRQLPGFIDLSALTLESGLDLMAAIERILEKMKPSSLKEELSILLQENRLGTPRKEALQHLAFRVNLPDIHSLTSIIIQSEELGTGLATVLRNYSEDMRNRRIMRAEELAGKMPVKLLFPMMVFFFPIVFVIIFGPLALNLMSNYK